MDRYIRVDGRLRSAPSVSRTSPCSAQALSAPPRPLSKVSSFSTVGIDVGGPNKGYHAVALRGLAISASFQSRDARAVARWCRRQEATVVAVDAPCRWRVPGQPARAAERELAAARISCFSTPTLEQARGHAFYTWMFAGQELYAALGPDYPVYAGDGRRARVAIETFPQAVACAWAGGLVSAKGKLAVRTALLRAAGTEPAPHVTRIDEIDAALCAHAAREFAAGTFKAYGDAAGGYIIVPDAPLARQPKPPAPPASPGHRARHHPAPPAPADAHRTLRAGGPPLRARILLESRPPQAEHEIRPLGPSAPRDAASTCGRASVEDAPRPPRRGSDHGACFYLASSSLLPGSHPARGSARCQGGADGAASGRELIPPGRASIIQNLRLMEVTHYALSPTLSTDRNDAFDKAGLGASGAQKPSPHRLTLTW